MRFFTDFPGGLKKPILIRLAGLADDPSKTELKSYSFKKLGSMTDKKNYDHWSELANQVGAEIPADRGEGSEISAKPDDAENSGGADSTISKGSSAFAECGKPSEPESSTAVESPAATIVPRKVRAYRPKSGWDDLAHEFELPAAAGPESPPSVEAEASHGEEETVWCGAEKFDALFDDSSSHEKDSSALKYAEDITFADAVTAASKEFEKEKSGEGKSEEGRKSGRRRKKRNRRPEKSDRRKEESEERFDDQVDIDRDEDAYAAAADTGGFAAGLYEREEREEVAREEREEGERPRGKRRRKRGSRRRKEPQQTVAEEALGETEEAIDEEISPATRRDDDGGESRGDEPLESDEDDLDGDAKTFSHRGIPTWDEAMEYIIAANFEKRAKKSSGGSQQRSKGGRGRGDRDRANSRKRPG